MSGCLNTFCIRQDPSILKPHIGILSAKIFVISYPLNIIGVLLLHFIGVFIIQPDKSHHHLLLLRLLKNISIECIYLFLMAFIVSLSVVDKVG